MRTPRPAMAALLAASLVFQSLLPVAARATDPTPPAAPSAVPVPASAPQPVNLIAAAVGASGVESCSTPSPRCDIGNRLARLLLPASGTDSPYFAPEVFAGEGDARAASAGMAAAYILAWARNARATPAQLAQIYAIVGPDGDQASWPSWVKDEPALRDTFSTNAIEGVEPAAGNRTTRRDNVLRALAERYSGGKIEPQRLAEDIVVLLDRLAEICAAELARSTVGERPNIAADVTGGEGPNPFGGVTAAAAASAPNSGRGDGRYTPEEQWGQVGAVEANACAAASYPRGVGAAVGPIFKEGDEGCRVVSMKAFTVRVGDRLVRKLAIFDVTAAGAIVGRVYPPGDGDLVDQGARTVDLQVDDRDAANWHYTLKIENGQISLTRAGAAPGDPGTLSIGLDEASAERARHAQQIGTVVSIGGVQYYEYGQGGARGSLLYFHKTRTDEAVAGSLGIEPSFVAQVLTVAADGTVTRIETPDLGVGEDGKRYRLRWVEARRAYVIEEGEGTPPPAAPAPAPPGAPGEAPATTTATGDVSWAGQYDGQAGASAIEGAPSSEYAVITFPPGGTTIAMYIRKTAEHQDGEAFAAIQGPEAQASFSPQGNALIPLAAIARDALRRIKALPAPNGGAYDVDAVMRRVEELAHGQPFRLVATKSQVSMGSPACTIWSESDPDGDCGQAPPGDPAGAPGGTSLPERLSLSEGSGQVELTRIQADSANTIAFYRRTVSTELDLYYIAYLYQVEGQPSVRSTPLLVFASRQDGIPASAIGGNALLFYGIPPNRTIAAGLLDGGAHLPANSAPSVGLAQDSTLAKGVISVYKSAGAPSDSNCVKAVAYWGAVTEQERLNACQKGRMSTGEWYQPAVDMWNQYGPPSWSWPDFNWSGDSRSEPAPAAAPPAPAAPR